MGCNRKHYNKLHYKNTHVLCESRALHEASVQTSMLLLRGLLASGVHYVRPEKS